MHRSSVCVSMLHSVTTLWVFAKITVPFRYHGTRFVTKGCDDAHKTSCREIGAIVVDDDDGGGCKRIRNER